jgi:hypothetical protein
MRSIPTTPTTPTLLRSTRARTSTTWPQPPQQTLPLLQRRALWPNASLAPLLRLELGMKPCKDTNTQHHGAMATHKMEGSKKRKRRRRRAGRISRSCTRAAWINRWVSRSLPFSVLNLYLTIAGSHFRAHAIEAPAGGHAHRAARRLHCRALTP